METFGERFKSVIVDHGITQKKLAEELNMSEVAISNYVSKGRIPSTDILIRIKQLFSDVDLNWLLTGSKSLNYSQKLNNDVSFVNESNLPYVISTDTQGNENVLMVPHYAQAGYTSGYNDPEYLETLPSYRLPKIDNGTFRMFEVRGHSMNPTMHDGAIAVGEWCESMDDVKDDLIYIVVTKEDGIVIKRVINRVNKYGNLYLKSDNRAEFPAYTVDKDQIIEIWKLKTAFIFNFSNPTNLYDRVNDLEAEMAQFRQQLIK